MPNVAEQTDTKRNRSYVRVPADVSTEIEMLAARYDVPARSLTRVLLCVGMEALRIDEARIIELLHNSASLLSQAADSEASA